MILFTIRQELKKHVENHDYTADINLWACYCKQCLNNFRPKLVPRIDPQLPEQLCEPDIANKVKEEEKINDVMNNIWEINIAYETKNKHYLDYLKLPMDVHLHTTLTHCCLSTLYACNRKTCQLIG